VTANRPLKAATVISNVIFLVLCRRQRQQTSNLKKLIFMAVLADAIDPVPTYVRGCTPHSCL